MKALLKIYILFFALTLGGRLLAQKVNGEIFIPITDRKEIWLKPRLDTLENKKEYEFKIRVSSDFTISQFLFEKGLAVQNDSVLVITANSPKSGGIDTAVLRVIVTSIKGSRIMLFQKMFLVNVPEKAFPVIAHPRTNVVMVNDKTTLERNQPYSKTMFLSNHAFLSMYDNANSMKKVDVQSVTIALFEKEGKQYYSTGDTLSADAVREIKKIKNPTPVYIRVDGQSGKLKKTVWNRIILYSE
jgi:hypothetical protein